MAWTKEDMDKLSERVERRIGATIRLAERYKQDGAKSNRIKANLCIVCYYEVRIAGSAFREFTCKNCGCKQAHPNTNVPVLCDDCAVKLSACKQCGAHLYRELYLLENK